jgi:hypothetical protein
VFNAYGFFAADQDQTSDATECQQTLGTAPAAAHSEAQGSAAVESDTAYVSGERRAPADSVTALPDTPDIAVPHSDVPAASEPATRTVNEGLRSVDAHLRAIENRLGNEPQVPDGASTKASANRLAHAEQRDRLTLKIAEHSVELIARLSNLSEDEKERLFGEIDSLLVEHGLSLTTATLNGEPLAQAFRTNQ